MSQSSSAGGVHDQQTICATEPVPNGWVIVSTTQKAGCAGPDPNAVVIESLPDQSGSVLTICSGQDVPTGWVMTGTTQKAGCTGPFPNAMIIKKL